MMNSIIKKIGIVLTCLVALSLTSPGAYAQIGIDVSITARIAPPALVVYTQPPCPYDGYLWTPGYWAYGDDGYFWVPGVWVRPPQPGFLWTPCYWGYSGGIYGWHAGYWGSHIGFYGGVNYGYGYGGSGFGGGRWEGGSFRYNTAVVNVNTTVIHNTYVDRTVVVNNTVVNNHTSYNGGPGGIAARPSAQEQVAMSEHHVQPTSEQVSHQQTASHDRNQFASVNHGRPATTTMNSVGGSHFNTQGHTANVSAAHQNTVAHNTANPSSPRTVQHTGSMGQGAHPATQSSGMHPAQQQHVQQHNMQPHVQQHVQQQHAPAPQAHPAGGGGHEAPHERHR